MFPWRYTNWDHPNPIVRRWHFLEALDLHVWVAFLAAAALVGLLLLWNRGRRTWVRKSVDAASSVLLACGLLYVFWRVFWSWSGYYY